MQPHDRSRFPSPQSQRRPPQFPGDADAPTSNAGALTLPSLPPPRLRLAGPALLVQARFHDITLASRLLRADEPRTFAIGAARDADAPANPAYLAEPSTFEPTLHVLVEPADGGFALNLSSAMRAELCTPVQQLAIAPDAGSVEAPLTLLPDCILRVPCGEVVFELSAAEPEAAVPRTWLAADWRSEGRYTLGVALLLLVLLAVVNAVPSDPRALSLDDLGLSRRFAPVMIIPDEINQPEVDRALDWMNKTGGSGAPAAAGEIGKAGDKTAPVANRRRQVKGPPAPKDASQVEAEIRANTLLAVLDGTPSGELAKVIEKGPALGGDADEAMGNLTGPMVGIAYGAGGLNALGSGAGGSGTHEGMTAGGGLGTKGRFGSGPGNGPGYGSGEGRLKARKATTPDPIMGIASVRGSLDKEIIRRIVRRHLNEVRYCYEQALPRNPSLAGRMVVQFTIAPTGQVLASYKLSSSLASLAVESCVTGAVKRWEFPKPDRGGLVIVSYPFQFSPAGG